MADPTNLDDVKVPDASFMDDYDTGGEYIPPPQAKTIEKGRPRFVQFEAQAPNYDAIKLKDAEGKWLKTRDGYLKAILEGIKLVESGYTIQQTHVGTAQYKKYKAGQPTGEMRNASPFMDYLRAHGIDLKPSAASEYEEYARATADRSFKVTIDWNAYDKDSQTDVAEKWEEFPDDPANPGQKLPYIEKDGKRFWARASIKRFVSAID
jgi:hypothetical protein